MTEQRSDPSDGFDLIEYPCVFSFKAMCRASSGDSQQIVRSLVIKHVTEQCIGEVQQISSRTGKFNSVPIAVHLDDRETLEAIYKELADSDEVVMTL